MDYSEADIEGLRISRSGGDGLDASFSIITCKNGSFEHSKDKGISVGEGSSVIISDSSFISNQMGIANKDQSTLSVSSSLFKDNRIAVAEFIKKPYFGRPTSIITNNVYKSNDSRYEWLGFYTY